MKCYHCGNSGHLVAQCRTRKKFLNQSLPRYNKSAEAHSNESIPPRWRNIYSDNNTTAALLKTNNALKYQTPEAPVVKRHHRLNIRAPQNVVSDCISRTKLHDSQKVSVEHQYNSNGLIPPNLESRTEEASHDQRNRDMPEPNNFSVSNEVSQ